MKACFTQEPVLKVPDPRKPFQIECDASDIATGAVLRQQDEEGKWHPCGYLSKTLAPAERNYQIYDKELLAIIRAFEAWRHYLLGSPHQIHVISDHQNLTYFRSARNLGYRQARWYTKLAEYNYRLEHKPGKTLTQADALSRRTGHEGGGNLNKEVVLLPDQLFAVNAVQVDLRERIRSNTARSSKLLNFLRGEAKTHPQWGKPEEWTEEDGLTIFQNRVYVPPDENLYRDIVKLYHDPPSMGHPGIQKTYELVKREFIWDQMRTFVTKYVQGCAKCQVSKVNTHPTKPGLVPIPHSGDTRPFRVITMDHITGLPLSNGYDSILNVVDHDVSKAAIMIPCKETDGSRETARQLRDHVYCRFGLPAKVISDRGPKFAAKSFRELHKLLGIETALTTAYHPQSDGQTERVNQEIDLALRIYCANDPNSWADHLAQFEFAHNQRTHSVTGKSPFELLYGYQPEAIGTVRRQPKHPSTDERLQELHRCRENSIAAHAQAAAIMLRRHPVGKIPFKLGDKVLLEGTNLKLPYPYRKLAPKREGPFEIIEVMGPVTFKLKLPKQWKIHPVFHANLLTPYRTTKEHGPDYIRPPPDIIEGEEEYEVEAILNHRIRGQRNKRYEYFLAWKGQDATENSWEPESNLKHAPDLLNAYKKRHRLARLQHPQPHH